MLNTPPSVGTDIPQKHFYYSKYFARARFSSVNGKSSQTALNDDDNNNNWLWNENEERRRRMIVWCCVVTFVNGQMCANAIINNSI